MSLSSRPRDRHSRPPWPAANHIAATAAEQLARALRPRPARRLPRWLLRLIDQRIGRTLAAELPEALEYLLSCKEVLRNGQAAPNHRG